MSTGIRWQTPWPQWRSHWQVLHAWPPGAQWLLLLLLSVCMTAAGSLWWSFEAWEIWWQADEQLQQLDEDINRNQQQVGQLRQRIQEIQALPHPSGWPVPAWQTWPQTPPPDDNQVLQQLLNWQSCHKFGELVRLGWIITAPRNRKQRRSTFHFAHISISLGKWANRS